jgi:lactoylglutathione lyase
VGLGVSDLRRSVDFYTRVCGMVELQTYHLSYMDEVIIGFVEDGVTQGARLVLMHWTDGSPRNYQDNPVKIVFQVPDARAFADRVRAAGYEIPREPGKSSVSNNVVGFARDPDGYQIEILQVTAG